MNKEIFFALLTVRILNLKFKAEQGWNPKMISFNNEKGNSIYLALNETEVVVNVYKVSASCYNAFIKENEFTIEQIELIAKNIKEKLKLIYDLKEE